MRVWGDNSLGGQRLILQTLTTSFWWRLRVLLFRRLWVFFFSVLGSYLCTNHSISTRTYVTCQPFTINMYQHVPTCQPFNINIFWNKPKNGCPGCRDPANYFGFSGKDLAENAETIRFALRVGWSHWDPCLIKIVFSENQTPQTFWMYAWP